MSWRFKALLQNVISLLPGSEAINHGFQNLRGAFSPGNIRAAYRQQLDHILRIHSLKPLNGATILEIGPGWYGLAVVLFHLLGSKKIYAVDLRPKLHLRLLRLYCGVLMNDADYLCSRLKREPRALMAQLDAIKSCRSVHDLSRRIALVYLAPGDARDPHLHEGEGIDLVYSYGVLEHIAKEVVFEILANSKRYLCTDGAHYHNIGLHDHFHSAGLGNGVNFLRYSRWQWNLIAGNSLAYHNRLRKPDYLKMIYELGFEIVYLDDELTENNLNALREMHVHEDFAQYSEADLATSHLFVQFKTACPSCADAARLSGGGR